MLINSGVCFIKAYFLAALEAGAPAMTAASMVALTIKGSKWVLVPESCKGSTTLRIIALAIMSYLLEGV